MYNDSLLQIQQLEQQKAQNKVNILDAQTNVKGYQGWLDNYGMMRETQLANTRTEGQQIFEGLMNNLGDANAVAGATGRVGEGTSMQGIGAMTEKKVTDYVGEDMKLDENGGLYGMNLGQQMRDLDIQKQSSKMQLDIYKTSLGNYRQADKDFTTNIASAKEQSAKLEYEKEKAANKKKEWDEKSDWDKFWSA